MRFEYTGVSDEGYGITIPRRKYKFRALCTSDVCRTKMSGANLTDAGTIKDVPKTTETCPDCEEYLFWEKTPA
jgi:hypothetical protein